MYSKELVQKIINQFPGSEDVPLPERFTRNPEPQVRIPKEKLKDVCEYLKTNPEMQFDLPIQMTAVDYIKENTFELVYYLYSVGKKHAIVLKVRIDRAQPEVDSVTPIWKGMDFQEREVFDLMGIVFNGHPNLKKIMMWDGFPGYPLRKDYVHTTDKYDSGLEIGTPGLDAKGIPIQNKPS